MSIPQSTSLTVRANPEDLQGLTRVPGRHHFGLNRRQYEFARHFSRLGNATRAYELAGYKPDPNGANPSRLAAHPGVRAAVKAFDEHRDARLEMDARALRAHTLTMAQLDVADFLDEHGNELPLRDVPVHVRRAVQGLKVTHRTRTLAGNVTETVKEVEIKAPDKVRATDLYARLAGHDRAGGTDVAGAVGRGIAALLSAMWRAGKVAPGAASVAPAAAAEPPIVAEFERL